MKLNYYAYYLHNSSNNKDYRLDLRPILKNFFEHGTVKFKSGFNYNDENVYLLRSHSDLFVYMMTRSHEIIKRINRHDLSVKEIYDILEKDEQLGFVSYVYFSSYNKQPFFSQASTLMAPRAKSLLEFINDLFKKLGLGHYEIYSLPLMHQATKEEVLTLPYLGKTSIEIGRDNGLFKDLFDFSGGSADDFKDVSSFEVIIKPRPKQDIRKAVKKFINKIDDTDLHKMIVRAKEDLDDSLTDLYLVGKGAIFDTITSGSEQFICESIQSRITENPLLKSKINEVKDDHAFENEEDNEPEDISVYTKPGSWTDFMAGLQDVDS